MTERWHEWGLSFEEWRECVEAAHELALLSSGERTPTAEEIAAQLAVAKAAEEPTPPGELPGRSVPISVR